MNEKANTIPSYQASLCIPSRHGLQTTIVVVRKHQRRLGPLETYYVLPTVKQYRPDLTKAGMQGVYSC